MSALSLSENQRGELLLTEQAHQLTAGGGKPGQGYQAVLSMPIGSRIYDEDGLAPTLQAAKSENRGGTDGPIVLTSSAAGSPAKTSPSPDNDAASPATAPDCSSSSPGSPTLFDPDGFSSRTYPDCSPATAVGTSESCLERWPTSGTAWDGGFSTHVTSECRSGDAVCSSSGVSLTEILEPPASVPAKYSLSARAATGILRRAEKRGRELPTHLRSALAKVAASAATESEPTKLEEAS